MKEWYIRQSPRDRIIVLAVAALTLIGLLYAFLWFPLNTKLASQRSAIATKTESLAFLEKGAVEIKAMGSGSSITKQSNKAPYQLIDQVIRDAGVSQPERVEPVGNDKARVQFSNVAFDKLVGVLAELELYSVVVDTVNLTRKNESGYVSARLTMVRN
jgi:type II secretory pathway component PulM